MKIITIGREFGSGGRELGKRLADVLGFDYYDREIITAIAGLQGLEEKYVEHLLEQHEWRTVPLTFRHSFHAAPVMHDAQVRMLVEQKRIVEAIAKNGRDCVIVGRNADVILADYAPFSIFVCAEKEAKLKRCMERAEPEENLSPKEMERNMRRIDKNRAASREIICDRPWGGHESYQLTINTTHWNIKELASAVAAFADSWFGREA